ncbi:hypothetical protein GBAR_LOCUS10736, partial [Geodia barretti]
YPLIIVASFHYFAHAYEFLAEACAVVGSGWSADGVMKKVAVLLALALSVGCAAAYVSSCDASAARNDCGYLGITESECEAKGCCWSPEDVR